ncbi:MAG: SPOR domain-containing protein [Polyangiaceae bacterium]
MSSTDHGEWIVMRQDDNGNRYELGRYATEHAAQEVVETFERRGHKQLYFVTRVRALAPDLE